MRYTIKSYFRKRCTPPERSFCLHTALIPLAIHQGLQRKIALSAGKNSRHSVHPAYEIASEKLLENR